MNKHEMLYKAERIKEILSRPKITWWTTINHSETEEILDIVKEFKAHFESILEATISVEIPTKQEQMKFFDDRLAELELGFVQMAVNVLKDREEGITDTLFSEIRDAHAKDPEWYGPFHLGWGMQVRNLLRNKGLNDSMLPTGNWDDYYVQLIEVAAGIRKVEGAIVE